MRRACLLIICIVLLGFSPLSAAEFTLIPEPEGQQSVIQRQTAEATGPFKSALRWRQVDLLKQLALPDGIAAGDELVLNLFPDAAYHATVDRVSVNAQGTVTVRGRLRDYPSGHVLITTTGDLSFATIRVPELGVEYTIVYDPASRGHYLLDHDPAKRDKLEEAPVMRPRPPKPEEQREIDTLRERIRLNQIQHDAIVTVDVLAVYTPAARTWAVANEGSISNTIAQAMAKGQLAADNSGVFVNVNLVHSAEVAYTEDGDSGVDLDRLQDPADGHMDVVHTLRNTYGADLVVLFENIGDTGGIGYLLESPFGEPAWGFSITRVQQASWTYTTIHEIGHNMGLAHHKAQNTEAGPGLFSYSAGWRWTGTDGRQYCSIMTYELGRYFADGITHERVAYFSNPGIAHLGTATGHPADGDNARTMRATKDVVAAYRQAAPSTVLTFPHIATTDSWQTEIAVINTNPAQTVTGTLKGFGTAGQLVETRPVITLSPRGRRQFTVSSEFASHASIGSIVFEANSGTVQGYTKFYREGIYRAAFPAVKRGNTTDIIVPHIASDAEWWTGISLLNTTPSTKVLTITFNDGRSVARTLTANQHDAFSIRDLFGGQPQPGIRSAVITNASGVIGLELFGSQDGSNQLDGILLTDNSASTLTYPHVAGGGWWTGIVAYNPSVLAATITITPYSVLGGQLTPQTRTLAGKETFVSSVSDLGLPAETAWFRIDSTRPLTGFELFGIGTGTAKQLAAYGGGGTGSTEGVFPKIERGGGWTGIAFVNTEAVAASVTLTAYTDAGAVVAAPRVLTVAGHAKVADLAENLFTQNIGSATYIAYSSTGNVVGFQINGSTDDTLLDGLPGLAD